MLYKTSHYQFNKLWNIHQRYFGKTNKRYSIIKNHLIHKKNSNNLVILKEYDRNFILLYSKQYSKGFK